CSAAMRTGAFQPWERSARAAGRGAPPTCERTQENEEISHAQSLRSIPSEQAQGAAELPGTSNRNTLATDDVLGGYRLLLLGASREPNRHARARTGCCRGLFRRCPHVHARRVCHRGKK